MTVCCGAGTTVAELDDALVGDGQCVAIPPHGTVGGALAVGRSGLRRLGYGPVRDTLLQARYVSAAGDVVKAGGPTVKNVTGFDLCRLLVGSHGTLGFIGEVILRTRPRARFEQWFSTSADPWRTLAALYRPTSVLWNGSTTWVLLEGDERDVDAAATAPCPATGQRATGAPIRRPVVAAAVTAARPDGNVRRRDRRRRRAPRRPGAGAGGRRARTRAAPPAEAQLRPRRPAQPRCRRARCPLTGRSSTARLPTCRPRPGSPSVSRPTSAFVRRSS